MKCIALRFADNFAPEKGTIVEHNKYIERNGYVYYGKLGSAVSCKNRNLILAESSPRILLIHSGGTERYWAYIDSIESSAPSFDEFPEYYHHMIDRIKTWFKVIRFEIAPKGIMSKCKVLSSGTPLNIASRQSMSPYFLVEYTE